ncbi:DUF3841 domain-containing protein [Streptomyces kronopolitis]|uniref:DUF3841 domain-containing protein n=1 Tax=Streptomyces kronopolitis TaxID=1612435 RepID=UPI003D974AD6
MRLWTAQHRDVVGVLDRTGRLVGDWDLVPSSWRPAYRVMAAEMARRGLDCAGRPPVWAWPEPDTRDSRVELTARLLLSDLQFAAGVVILDLEVPDAYVLRSSYSAWNDLLCEYLDGARSPAMDWAIAPEEENDPDRVRVQACLPLLRHSWVRGIRPIEPPEPLDE